MKLKFNFLTALKEIQGNFILCLSLSNKVFLKQTACRIYWGKFPGGNSINIYLERKIYKHGPGSARMFLLFSPC